MRVKINNRFFTGFTKLTVNLAIDKVASTFIITGRFNPNLPEHRDIFRPLSYNVVEIFDNFNNIILTGNIINHKLRSKSSPTLSTFTGYSKPGILEDVTISTDRNPLELTGNFDEIVVSTDRYTLENNEVSLTEIAQKILEPFNIQMVIDGPTIEHDMGLPYDRVVAEESETIKEYLSKLTSQRNIVLSHTAKGELLFFRPNIAGKPTYFFNTSNTLEMETNTNGQGLHSHIAVVSQPDIISNDRQTEIILNPIVGVYRPVVKVQTTDTDVHVLSAAYNKLASELKNIRINVLLDRFINVKIGDIVEVQNKEIYLFNRTRMIVSMIKLEQSEKGDVTKITLMMPETFTGRQAEFNSFLSGEAPERLPEYVPPKQPKDIFKI